MNVKYLIIGNSAAGIGAIESIRKNDADSSIAVISDENMYAYSRALIPYYLQGKIEKDQLYLRDEDFYKKNDISPIFGKKVVNIKPNNNKITLKDSSEIEYEYLIIASGGKPFIPTIKGLNDNFYSFTSFKDVENIKKEISTGNTKEIVILGAGLIGLLAAESLKSLNMNITVIELADRILINVLDPLTSNIYEQLMKEHDIQIVKGHTISEIRTAVDNNEKIRKVILDNNDELDCDLLIIATGVRPRVQFLKNTNIEINRGIIVNPRMQTNVANIYACGDCAEVYDFIHNQNKITPIWPAAYIGGLIAGSNLTGQNTKLECITNMNSMKFFGLPVMSAGLIEVPEENGYQELMKYDQKNIHYKKLILKDGTIKGLISLNQIENTGIILNLMRNRIDVSEFKDRILESDFDLIDLPRYIRKEMLTGG
ncbi:MAG: NAD(P)/FAD-dependent oxidoreductase [Candidatus Lokiarchaeota archaeon]|nr:NAD(P)/FAD-dependent oxidoreductase [Candidatus Lokiarchaeota archaeon]